MGGLESSLFKPKWPPAHAGCARAAMFFVAHGGQQNQIASSTQLAPALAGCPAGGTTSPSTRATHAPIPVITPISTAYWLSSRQVRGSQPS